MGTFAYSMFSGMLSWFRTAVNWLWNTLVSPENGGLISWIGENWLWLIIGLSVICMCVDMLVHLLRWRPDKVWVSFFRRMFAREDEEDTPDPASGKMRREWHYADGTARTEEVEVPQEEWPPVEELPPVPVSELPPQYVQSFARPENLKYQEEMKKEQPVGLEDYPQPMPERPRRVATRTEGLQKRMARLQARMNEEDELELRYRPAPPAVDKREAYHQPYIPPQWKRPGPVGASQEEDEDEHAF